MSGSPWHCYGVVRSGPMAGRVRDEVPVNDFTIVERLKGVGSVSATVPSHHPKATPAALDVENTVLVVEKGGIPMASGPFLSKHWSSNSNMWQISSEGPFRILRDRVIRDASSMTYGTVKAGEVGFSQVEQFDIVRDLIDHANGIEATGFTVDTPFGASGILRDRSYEADKAKSIGVAIEQLADVEDGFDWAVDIEGSALAGDLTYVLRLVHPYRARETGYNFTLPAAQMGPSRATLVDGLATITDETTGAVLVVESQPVVSAGSGNVISAEYTETAQDRVSRFTAIGPGEGAAQLVAHATDTELVGVLPLIERGGSWLDVTRVPTLQGHANRELTLNRRASRIPKVTVNPNREPQLSAYRIGDVVRVRLDEIGFNELVRIITRTIHVTAEGAETVDLEFAEIGRFA